MKHPRRHLWALRWDRGTDLLEVLGDDHVRDISRHADRLGPGKAFRVETCRGRKREVHEDVGHIKFDEILLGQLHLARNCRVTMDDVYVCDQALSREVLRQAYARVRAGQPVWPASALPTPARRPRDGADFAAADPARPAFFLKHGLVNE